MELIINGETLTLPAHQTVAALLEQRGLAGPFARVTSS